MKNYLLTLTTLSALTASGAAMASESQPIEFIDPPTPAMVRNEVKVGFLQTSDEELQQLSKLRNWRNHHKDDPIDTSKGFPFAKLPLDAQKLIVSQLDGKSAVNFSAVSPGCYNLVALRGPAVYGNWYKALRSRLDSKLYTDSGNDAENGQVRMVQFNCSIDATRDQLIKIGQDYSYFKLIIYLGANGRYATIKPISPEELEAEEIAAFEEEERRFNGFCDDSYNIDEDDSRERY